MIAQRPTPNGILSPEQRQEYRRMIEERTGIRLNPQQVRDLGETVAAALALAGDEFSPATLLPILARGGRRDLFAAIAERVTIGETHFFRVAPQIAALRDVILPDLLSRHTTRRRLALWSAGCSSGEEPYTLAILVREALPDPDRWHIQLLATDLSEAALDTARRATYRDWSFRETPAHIRGRYFDSDGANWRLHGSIRRMVHFGQLNLIADPFPAPSATLAALDLILCRNVAIYFGPQTVVQLHRRFAAALTPGGWLVLGPSDPPPAPESNFEPVYLNDAIVWRKRAQPAPTLVAASPATSTPEQQPRPVRPVEPPRPRPARKPTARPTREAATAAVPAAAPPAPLEGRLREALALALAGERDAARALLAEVIRTEPLAVAAHRLLGLLALEDGQAAAALDSLRRATFLAADDPLAQFGLGRAYGALGDAARAGAAFRQARRILATWPGQRPVPGDEGSTADELLRATEAQLAQLGLREGGAP